VKADAFVPCGGRPNSIHEKNAHEFLDADGQPSSKLIVEGANLFLTPDARQYLSEHGTLILKDSSANKCGVICSSYEIAACMLLSEEQFLSIKPVFVAQVIDKLRDLARREVELLTRLHRQQPQVPVPDLSIRLSRVMIRTADAIEAAIEQVPESQKHLLQKLVQEHLPEVLVDMVGDEIWTRLPQTYLNWVMAKSLAARIAYRDGIDYLETMPASEIAGLAVQYLALELERKQLASEVANSNLPDRKRIVEILDSAGIISTISPDFVEPEHDEQTE
jgi:glutamate dehydrogenase